MALKTPQQYEDSLRKMNFKLYLMGELIEIDTTAKMFTAPSDMRTDDYIAGRFG